MDIFQQSSDGTKIGTYNRHKHKSSVNHSDKTLSLALLFGDTPILAPGPGDPALKGQGQLTAAKSLKSFNLTCSIQMVFVTVTFAVHTSPVSEQWLDFDEHCATRRAAVLSFKGATRCCRRATPVRQAMPCTGCVPRNGNMLFGRRRSPTYFLLTRDTSRPDSWRPPLRDGAVVPCSSFS